MPNQRVIFIDMDGVLSNFVQAAFELFDQPTALESLPAGCRDLPKALGVSSQQFWQRIGDAGSRFWSDLEPYPWFDELLGVVDPWPWYILTSPSRFGSSADGKMQWLRRYLGEDFRRFLISPQKQLLARPGAILIDDLDPNIERFSSAGGTGLLFPRKWNANHAFELDPMPYVRQRLDLLDWQPQVS